MKLFIMAFKKTLLFGILTTFNSCSGQNQTTVESNPVPTTNLKVGDTVTEISKNIWSFFQDRKENFWFGSNDEGVYRYDGKNVVQFTIKDGLGSNSVRSIQEDKFGNIYFGSGSVVSRFDGQSIVKLSRESQNPISDFSKMDWKTEPDDLWFQAGNGVYRYDGKSLHYLEFPKTKLGDEFYDKYSGVSSSPYQVYSIYKDKKGNPWFGTQSLGVCHYDGKSFTWIDGKRLGNSIRSILEDKNGNYWFGNSGTGVYRYKDGNLINYTEEKGIGNKAPFVDSYTSIIEDKNGDLWFASYASGVWRYDGEKVINYTTKDGLSSNHIMVIYEDKKGNIWVATDEGGVCKFDGKTFKQFRIE